jgi:hypothetical protein
MRIQLTEWPEIYPFVEAGRKRMRYQVSHERAKLRRNTNAYLRELGHISKGENVNAWIKALSQDERVKLTQMISAVLDQKRTRLPQGVQNQHKVVL